MLAVIENLKKNNALRKRIENIYAHFLLALFVTAKVGKQPKGPSAGN